MDILQPRFRRPAGVLEGKTHSFNFGVVQITASPRPSASGKVDLVSPIGTPKRFEGLIEDPVNLDGLGARYCYQRFGDLFADDEHR